MTKELDEQLCAEFPLIFRDRHAEMRQTAMCWGFECGDGWYPLIRHLCLRLTHKLRTAQESYDFYASMMPEQLASGPEWIRAGASPDKQAARLAEIARLTALVPVASQVKEKYGHLRFYVHGCTDEDAAIIREAEAISGIVCEVCGMTAGTMTYTDGWHQTLCPTCAEIEGRKEMSDEDSDE